MKSKINVDRHKSSEVNVAMKIPLEFFENFWRRHYETWNLIGGGGEFTSILSKE